MPSWFSMTPDDEAHLREPFRVESDPPHETQLSGQARPNVLFEAGMAMGRDADRTVLVEVGTLRPFSDVAGLHTIRLDGSSQRRQELAQRLLSAGCPVNMDGTDWHTAGAFETALDYAASAEESAATPENREVSEDAVTLLLCAAKDSSGEILKIVAQGGSVLQVRGTHFGELRNPRSQARWERALRELVDARLVEDSTGRDRLFEVTHEGFQRTDQLESED